MRRPRHGTKFILTSASFEACAEWASRAQLALSEWAWIEPVEAGAALRVYELVDDSDGLADRLAPERRARD